MIATQDISARDLIDFYLEAGADALVGEEPVDRFAAVDAPPVAARAPLAAAPRAFVPSVAPANAPLPPDEAALAARAAAKSAATLDDLRVIVENFDGCALKATATRAVFADGTPGSRVMLVGEAPGRDEDIEGLPFVGRSGKLLDLMLKSIGLDRNSVYIANIVPWRPPGTGRRRRRNRPSACPSSRGRSNSPIRTFWSAWAGLRRRLCSASKKASPVRAESGIVSTPGNAEIPAMPTFHPAFLLRSPLQKRFAWRDLLAVQKALTE